MNLDLGDVVEDGPAEPNTVLRLEGCDVSIANHLQSKMPIDPAPRHHEIVKLAGKSGYAVLDALPRVGVAVARRVQVEHLSWTTIAFLELVPDLEVELPPGIVRF